MTALALATQPAYPLGKPADRDRYGMTAEQACLYRWLVQHKPHDRAFNLNSRAIAPLFLTKHSAIHHMVENLMDRGWIEKDDAGYKFVQPVMRFREPRG